MRTARGISRAVRDSPELMTTISTPPKVYMANPMASSGANQPLGRKPPCEVNWGATRPVISSPAPMTINAAMVTTLIMANQYSKRPKLPTLRELTSNSTMEKITTQIKADTVGNQYAMYVDAASNSSPTEDTIAAQ